MSDSKSDKARTDTEAPEETHLEDEEKVLAGRHDVDLPSLLVKDVPGG
jgi:hypothetical protein